MFKNVVVFTAGAAVGGTFMFVSIVRGLRIAAKVQAIDPSRPMPQNVEEFKSYMLFCIENDIH